jgi:uncharacterized RDD family membrane protein YckC
MDYLDDGFNAKPLNKVVYATFWSRVAASLVDTLLILLISMPLTYFNITTWKSIPVLLLATGIGAFYKPYMEYTYSATLGKMLMRIVVTNYDFGKPNVQEIGLRNIITIASSVLTIISSIYLYSLPEFKNITGYMEYQQFVVKHSNFSALNNIIGLVFMVDILIMFGDAQLRTFHDKIGKTYVIKTDSVS